MRNAMEHFFLCLDKEFKLKKLIAYSLQLVATSSKLSYDIT